MTDIEENISFEYDDTDDDDLVLLTDNDSYDMNGYYSSEHDVNDDDDDDGSSSFSLETDGDEDEIFEDGGEDIEPSTTPMSKTLYDARVGFNGTLYHPWTVEHYVRDKFIAALGKLKKGQLPHCTEDDLLIMLQAKKWQPDEVLNEYFDNHDRFYETCGLPIGKPSNNTFETVKNFDCFVCCETYPSTTVYSLTCDHKYCIDCYYTYIENEISNRGGRLITCITPDCKYTIPHKDISHMLAIIESRENYIVVNKPLQTNLLLLAHARQLIEYEGKLRWCPAPDCGNFAELASEIDPNIDDAKQSVDLSIVPIVNCADNHEFCFNCNFENHLPCPCWLVKKWIKKCQDDSETAHWIDANTHACPKCHTSIEKNGGCNHMTCRSCHHEFCWICSGDWSEHSNNYTCNKFKGEPTEEEIRKNRSRLTLERYLHFYKRYSIHENSMKGDMRTLQKIDQVTRLYMENRRKTSEKNLSWNDIQFLPDAMRALQNGRKTLKWTYCFAFYLSSTNFSEIFETNQDFLNKSVEDLSEIFEQIMDKKNVNKVDTILKNKLKIRNLSELVSARQKTLIRSAEDNLKSKLLKFEF
ncbi:uncharacterized protein J8A68_004292 [[Candida] subhashii]|uniref:RBR-type E3 ubiquitin transferase n=1 Tax=[Candida] subhashii TaxID=561895 RepID=A0A8J5UX42_9ASCO|nr:uncharacterized protein J8A68_004292 [[Candida] subhashii]KAG7662164.1 hypothetical protein J8A68_004292 [[Candida] subhashii]